MASGRRPIDVLFVEDCDDDVQLELAVLRRGGFDPRHVVVDTREGLRALLERRRWDVVICDFRLPSLGGLDALRLVRSIDADVPFILVSGTVGEDVAVEAMRTGAQDYVLKDNLARLSAAVARELAEAQVRSEKRKVERAQRFLAEASATLAESLDYETTLSRVARLAVPELGDVCAVDLIDDGGQRERVAIQRIDGGEGPPPEDHAQHIVVPLIARGRVLGTISFGGSRPDLGYGPAELEIARELAARAALAVDNAKLYQEAQRAVRVRDEFLSIASHELKTPLTAIQLQLQNLREIVDSGRSNRELLAGRLGRTSQSTERLSLLVESLLDVSRIATGRVQLHRQAFDLADAARAVADRLKERAQRAGSTLSLPRLQSVRGSWDRLRVEQVLINLLSNAIKYGCGRPIELNVQGGERARIEVVDHGIGIAACDLHRIFERFERAVPMRHYGGLGLGLYVTHQIVTAHGGKVMVESTPGAGATFVVELPLDAADDAGAQPHT